ncbi:MAG TPA: hypothetical protein VKQ36_08485 [Ktedonobacterales bacterium]|nr:hypothetical protein [Ktedonobacterales bacterium]
MIDVIGPVDNFTVLPTPVLDDNEASGVRIEQRMQVSLKSAADEDLLTIEFRPGADGRFDTDAPSEALLNQWIESGELIQAFCSSVRAQPFQHKPGKTYRKKGKSIQVGAETVEMESFVVFAGVSMAPLAGGPALDEQVRKARASYKAKQREYRAKRNAERVAQMEAQMGERVQQMRERQAAQQAAQAAQPTEATAANGANGRRRS